jgi:hypothetical protein
MIKPHVYVTSFGRIKQIHHVRSWKRQTKGIIYLASVLDKIHLHEVKFLQIHNARPEFVKNITAISQSESSIFI